MKHINTILALTLIILSIAIFAVYIWFGINYNHIAGGWGAGIWLVAVGVFTTGILLYIDRKK
jgi:steroid 5-alpha reductase family enzyme